MSNPIQNRYDFLFLFDCTLGNPNGDPDAGNAPRMDPETLHGLVSDVCLKRKIRNYIQVAKENKSPYSIFIAQGDVLNRTIQQAHAKQADLDAYGKADNRGKNELARKWMCQNFFDVRTFEAVMGTNQDESGNKTAKNAGQVRGPVQLTFARSIDPVMVMEPAITRVAVATYEEEKKREEKGTEAGTFGHKNLISYGLYACQGFVSANIADDTGFSEQDLALLWEAMVHMFEDDRSAARGLMAPRSLMAFKHTGTDSDTVQRGRQAKLGCAPAQKLIEIGRVIEVKKKPEIASPRSFDDYEVSIYRDRIPKGVELLEIL